MSRYSLLTKNHDFLKALIAVFSILAYYIK